MNRKLLLSLLLILFAGCSKDKVAPKTPYEQLTAHTWYVQSIIYDGKSLNSPCLLGNYFVFNTNGSGYFDEGQVKCNATDSQRYSFNYTLSHNDSLLNLNNVSVMLSNLGYNSNAIDSPINNLSCNVTKLNDTYLELVFHTRDNAGKMHTCDYLFVDN